MKSITFCMLMALAAVALGQDLAGTWYSAGNIDTPGGNSSKVVLLPDGHFHVQWDYAGGFTDPIYGWGAYSWDGRQLILQYFGGDKQVYELRNVSQTGFVMYYPAEDKSWDFSYQGAPALEEWKQNRLHSESVFYQLTGQWACNGQLFKFMGDGTIFVAQENETGTLYNYVVLGNTLKIHEITSTPDNPLFEAPISDLTSKGFHLTTNQGSFYYAFQGNAQLTGTETFLYTQYLNMIHRTNMSTIDGMDGVRDFIWKRVDQQGNETY